MRKLSDIGLYNDFFGSDTKNIGNKRKNSPGINDSENSQSPGWATPKYFTRTYWFLWNKVTLQAVGANGHINPQFYLECRKYILPVKGTLWAPRGRGDLIPRSEESRTKKVCTNKPCNLFVNFLPKPKLGLDSPLMSTQTLLRFLINEHWLSLSCQLFTNFFV